MRSCFLFFNLLPALVAKGNARFQHITAENAESRLFDGNGPSRFPGLPTEEYKQKDSDD